MSTVSNVVRTDDPSGGDTFATRDKASGVKTQGMHLDPEVMGDVLNHYASAAAEVSAVNLATGPGRLFEVSVILLSTVVSDRYLHVFDSVTAAGTPVLRAFIPAGGQASIDLGVWGRNHTAGITVAVSSTLAAYTAVGAEAVYQVRYA